MKPLSRVGAACTIALLTAPAYAYDFNAHNMIIASMKIQQGFDYEAHVDGYMREFRPAVWRKYREDEFELHSKEQQTITMMKEKVSGFSLDNPFTINSSFKFGKYNFDKKQFPLDGVGANSYYSTSDYVNNSFPSEYKVQFDNTGIIGDIHMRESTAKQFLDSRKQYGSVNRQVPVKIEFRLKQLKPDQSTFIAHITNVKVYRSNSRSDVIAEFESS